ASPSLAQEESGPTLSPLEVPVGGAQLDLGGMAGGALFDTDFKRQRLASGVLKAVPQLHRDYDSGLLLGLEAPPTIRDALSRGRYGGDFFEKIFAEARTGLGRVQLGQADGAGYALSVTGPKVDAQVSLDDSQTSFFLDPTTHHAVADMFALRTEVGASS